MRRVHGRQVSVPHHTYCDGVECCSTDPVREDLRWPTSFTLGAMPWVPQPAAVARVCHDRSQVRLMAKVRQARRCTARRSSDGQPCRAWAMVGCDVCSGHGGLAPQTLWAAYKRDVMARTRRAVAREVAWRQKQDAAERARQLMEADAVLAMETDEAVGLSWPRSWALAVWSAPELRERHEARVAAIEEATDRRRQRVMQQIRRRERWWMRRLTRHGFHVEWTF